MKNTLRLTTGLFCASAALFLSSQAEGFAGLLQKYFSMPVLRALGFVFGACTLPAAEILSYVLLGFGAISLMVRIALAVKQKSSGPVYPWLRGAALGLSVVVLGYAVLWYPAYFAPQARPYAIKNTSSAQMESLCRALICRIEDNAYGKAHFSPQQAVRAVAEETGRAYMRGSRVKTALCAGWLRAIGACGIFLCWTGEAVVSPELPDISLPFTACHEAAHMQGIADEAQASIAAYNACKKLGGDYALSADVWALKYAMNRLCGMDAQRFMDVSGQIPPNVRRLLAMAGGYGRQEISVFPLFRWIGLADFTTNYAQMAHYLANTQSYAQ